MQKLADVVIQMWWWRIFFTLMALYFMAHSFPFVLFGFTSVQLVNSLSIFVHSLYLLLVLLSILTARKAKRPNKSN